MNTPEPEDETTPIEHDHKAEALAIRTQRSLELQSSGSALLSEFLKDSEQRGLAKMTLVRYSCVCKEFLDHAGSMAPTEIRPRDIREYLAWCMNRGASNHALRQNLCALRSMFRFAEAMEIIRVSPARAIQTRRYHRAIPEVLDEKEVNRLINAATNVRDKALLETIYATACRVGEIARIRVQDVSWSQRTIVIEGKGNKQRIVPLHAKAVRLLKKYLGTRDTGWLFQGDGPRDQRGSVIPLKSGKWRGVWRTEYSLDPDVTLVFKQKTKILGDISEMSREEAKAKLWRLLKGKLKPRPRLVQETPLTPFRIRLIIKTAALRAGIDRRVYPHLLRHCCATHLLDHGADLLTIGRFLGHESISTTQIYTHVSQRKMQDTLEQFHPHWGQNENKS